MKKSVEFRLFEQSHHQKKMTDSTAEQIDVQLQEQQKRRENLVKDLYYHLSKESHHYNFLLVLHDQDRIDAFEPVGDKLKQVIELQNNLCSYLEQCTPPILESRKIYYQYQDSNKAIRRILDNNRGPIQDTTFEVLETVIEKWKEINEVLKGLTSNMPFTCYDE